MSLPSSPGDAARITKRRGETRARLIDAAIQVFAQKGYGHVTINDVCTAAGYSRGAFYSHFDNLEELLFVVYHQWTIRIADEVRAALEVNDPLNDLPKVAARIVDALLIERDWLLIKLDLLSVAARNPALAQRWCLHRAQLRMVIEERLNASGIELHKSIDSVTDTARAIIAIYDGLSTQLVLYGEPLTAHTWLTELLTVLLMPPSAPDS